MEEDQVKDNVVEVDQGKDSVEEDHGKDSVMEVDCPSEEELRAEPQTNISCTVERCDKTFTTSAARNIHVMEEVDEVHCPSEEELRTEPQTNVPCTVEGGDKTFTTSAARNIHVMEEVDQGKDSVVEVRCPSEEELCTEPQTNVPCTVDRCNKTFTTSAARNIHVMEEVDYGKDSVVEFHCPSEEELRAEPQTNVPCTVEGCEKTFTTSAARNIHVIRTHKIYKDEDERKRFSRSHQKTMSKVTKLFYCPVRMCNRSPQHERPFTRLSLLKQHYYILHAEKKYECAKCQKRFSTQRPYMNHERDCGKEFYCTCGEKHNSMTALYMHTKRKQHELPIEFMSKRRKRQEPVQVRENYVLVVPVPFNNIHDIHRTLKEPFLLLPHPSTRIPAPSTAPSTISSSSNTEKSIVLPARGTGLAPSTSTGGRIDSDVAKVNPKLVTSSTQTEEEELEKPEPKQETRSSYAQTAHSCFPSYIPMNGPKTFKRHKKTLAVQTQADWPQQDRAVVSETAETATSETQTLGDQGSSTQTQTVLDLRTAIPDSVSSPDQSVSSEVLSQQFDDSSVACSQQASSSSILGENEAESSSVSSPVDSEQASKAVQEIPVPAVTTPIISQELGDVVPGDDSQSQPCPVAPLSMDADADLVPPNEVLTQTDLTFQNFMEYNTSETQTFASVSDAMTDTSETSARSPEPTLATTSSVSTSLIGNDQNTMTAAADLGMSGLDLLFYASTEHRANSSLDMPRMDDSSCCQQTQTGLEIDTGHQETQTVWDWSLDEFSFLDQYTQTAQSATDGSSSTIPETDQFSQTGMGLYSQFNFSNMETQTVSVFDLEMFGNSISVQTEAGSESVTSILGGDSLTNVGTQVQAPQGSSQQEMVSADVQTEATDVKEPRSKQLGNSHLASSQTQTSFWEDIESIIRSDSFTQTQTQFPQ